MSILKAREAGEHKMIHGHRLLILFALLASIAIFSQNAFATVNCPRGTTHVQFDTTQLDPSAPPTFTPSVVFVNGFSIVPDLPYFENDTWHMHLRVCGVTRCWLWDSHWEYEYYGIDGQAGHTHNSYTSSERRRVGGRFKTFSIFTKAFRDPDFRKWGSITGVMREALIIAASWTFCIGQSIKSGSISSGVPNSGVDPASFLLTTELQAGNLLVESQGERVQSVRLQLFDIQGRVFVDRETLGNAAASHMDSAEKQLANGVYFYLVTVKGSNGTVYRSQVKKLIVSR